MCRRVSVSVRVIHLAVSATRLFLFGHVLCLSSSSICVICCCVRGAGNGVPFAAVSERLRLAVARLLPAVALLTGGRELFFHMWEKSSLPVTAVR